MRTGTGNGPGLGRGRWRCCRQRGQARAAAPLPDCTTSEMTVTCTYTAAGTFTVPGRVTSVHVAAEGGHGATGRGDGKPGGPGAQVTANLAVTPGQTLLVEVDAGGGAGRGSATYGGGDGGGRSAVGTAQDPSLLVAGGGGGGGGFGSGGDGGAAGGADPGTCHAPPCGRSHVRPWSTTVPSRESQAHSPRQRGGGTPGAVPRGPRGPDRQVLTCRVRNPFPHVRSISH